VSEHDERLPAWVRVQLSDFPWLVVSGSLGLATEALAVGLGGWSFTAGGLFWLKVVGFYGFLLGYTAFRCNRSAAGVAIGALAGVAYALANRFVHPFQVWHGPEVAEAAAWIAWTAALPWVTDRVVDPRLLRGPFRRIAGWHPRYAHLRER
jgi:hypothetical protein